MHHTCNCKVVHVSTKTGGGAGGAASRLHRGLKLVGMSSRMYVAHGQGENADVTQFQPFPKIWARTKRYVRRKIRALHLSGRSGQHGPFNDTKSGYGKAPIRQFPEADVVNLHWIARFIDYESFFAHFGGIIPVVWRLPDMNPFTGGCHYDEGCRRFTKGCGNCPQLSLSGPRDLSHRVWQRKRKIFSRLSPEDLHLVALCDWMQENLAKSPLLEKFPVTVIPNGLDTDAFAPRNRRLARDTLGIPETRKVVLFVAQTVTNSRKGFSYLVDAVADLPNEDDTMLVSVGNGGQEPQGDLPYLSLGFVQNDRLLSLAYSAADVFVIPSLQDNLPNTVLESMSCGTPVVGFDVGGIPDMVRPGETGLLAEPENSDDLARCIRRLLDNDQLRSHMSHRCREVAVDEYNLELQARRYMELYREMLEENRD